MATIIEMPKLSDTMTVGTLITWLKKEGDTVKPGDMIAEVETDKATMELENFEEGVLLKQYAKEGDEVPVGAPVCAVGEKGETAPDMADKPANVESTDASEQAAQEKKQQPKPVAADKPAPRPAADPAKEAEAKKAQEQKPAPEARETDAEGRIKASPLARKIAEEKGVDLSTVEGTGPGGRIVREDIMKAAERPAAPQAAAAPATSATPAHTLATAPGLSIGGEDKIIKVSNMRGAIARRLLESKTTIPHFYLEMEIDSAPMSAMRESLNAGLAELKPEQGGMKLTVNDFILKGVVEALRRVPAANASWQGDKIVQYGSVHLAFAVAVEEGLVTPTIRNADQKTMRQIAAEARVLIKKARDRKLKPDEMSGSTFTISNLGMYGITNFYGIINPPNGAILSVGASIKKPVVDANDNIVVGQRMSLGLSGDHRVVDGAVGAEFLVALRKVLETPALMLV